jgi:radical SAM superfamily enzyme YgiQ (UPF0313 family)
MQPLPGARTGGPRSLAHVILLNPSYPSRLNDRGSLDVPEIRVGAATLPLLSALVRRCRPGCEILMYDEIGTPVDLDRIDRCPRERSLVLMSVRTTLAAEARAWSERLRKMGFAVVIGGPHASACLEEVAGYASAAVHGEAEVHLASVIDAFEAGRIEASTRPGLRFESDANCDMRESPPPDLHLYRHSRTYMQPGTLEFGRGCQYRCSFCASTNLYTRGLRHKAVDQVIAEIGSLPVYPGGFRVWFFGDDNFASVHGRARELATAIGRAFPRAHWGCAITSASAGDGALLDALVAGGMRTVFVGFDSIVQDSLTATNKNVAPASRFRPLIANLKSRGIFVIAALVFGFDHDRTGVFADTLRWALDSGVDVLNLNVARPYPSSPMYEQLRRERRLLRDPWWLQPFEERLAMVHGLTANLAGVMTAYLPCHMTPRDLAEGTLWVGQEFYRARHTIPRLLRNARSPASLVVDALTNYFYAREYRSFTPVADPARAADASRGSRRPDAVPLPAGPLRAARGAAFGRRRRDPP